MRFAPDMTELMARARADLRMGVPIVIADGADKQLVFAVETLSDARFDVVRGDGAGTYLALTARRAQTLKIAAYDGDLVRLKLPADADLRWLHAMADPADDLKVPMKGPVSAVRVGPADTARAALALIKTARLLPAAALTSSRDHDVSLLTHLPLSGLGTLLQAPHAMMPVVDARLPLEASEAGRLHVFRPDDGGEEHYAIEIGRPDRQKPVLARLHSACFTGDVMGSLKCDCGPQLRAALATMGAEGAGMLLYLNQEGRGIGLANKMRAYALQNQGFDTVEANHRLGFEDDERDFRIGAELLSRLGFSSVRLLTNNPAKIVMMEGHGIAVTERVPLKVGENRHNQAYLATKARKSGHLL